MLYAKVAKFLSGITGKVALVLFAVVALTLTLRYCDGKRQEAEQAKQDTRSANATAETAKEAAERVIGQAGEEAEIDDLVNQTAKEIENAETPADARRAAIAAICRMPNYRNDPDCQL